MRRMSRTAGSRAAGRSSAPSMSQSSVRRRWTAPYASRVAWARERGSRSAAARLRGQRAVGVGPVVHAPQHAQRHPALPRDTSTSGRVGHQSTPHSRPPRQPRRNASASMRPRPGGCSSSELERALAAAGDQPPVDHRQAGRRALVPRARAPDLEGLAADAADGPDLGRERADAPLELHRGPGEVERPVLGRDLGGERHALLRLGRRRQPSGLQAVERLHQQGAADPRQARHERAAVLPLAHAHALADDASGRCRARRPSA